MKDMREYTSITPELQFTDLRAGYDYEREIVQRCNPFSDNPEIIS